MRAIGLRSATPFSDPAVPQYPNDEMVNQLHLATQASADAFSSNEMPTS